MQDMQPALQLSAVSSDCVARSCVNWVGLCYSGGFRGYTRHGPYCGGFPEKTCSLGGNYPQHKVACEVFAHGGGGGGGYSWVHGIVSCMYGMDHEYRNSQRSRAQSGWLVGPY